MSELNDDFTKRVILVDEVNKEAYNEESFTMDLLIEVNLHEDVEPLTKDDIWNLHNMRILDELRIGMMLVRRVQ